MNVISKYQDYTTTRELIKWVSILKSSYYYKPTDNRPGIPKSTTTFNKDGEIVSNKDVVEESIGFNNISKYNDVRYYNTGQSYYKSTSLGGITNSQVTYAYYADGRVNTETNNITNGVTTYTYNSNSVTTNFDGNNYTKTYDNWGNIKENDEPSPGGSIYYKYYSHGHPMSIQSPASTVTMTYDALGKQATLTDPDAGTITYRYDPMGRLTYQDDANGNITYQLYDSYGRISQKEDGTKTLTYQYAYTTSGGGLGKIQQITAANGTYESYTYDNLGRLSTTTKYIDASDSYTYTDIYDQYGNIT